MSRDEANITLCRGKIMLFFFWTEAPRQDEFVQRVPEMQQREKNNRDVAGKFLKNSEARELRIGTCGSSLRRKADDQLPLQKMLSVIKR